MPQPTEADPTLTGLYAHPVAAALLNEALALLGDGAPADAIEAAATASGISTGVLALLDAVSLEVVDHALHDELHALEHEHEHEHHHEAGHEHAHDKGTNHAKHQHDRGHAHSHGHAGHVCDDPKHKHNHDHGHAHSQADTKGHAHAYEHGSTHAHGRVPDPVPVALPMPTAKAHGHTHSHKIKSQQMTEAAVYVVEKMAHGYRRLGRVAGAGFYDYGSDMPQLWSGLKTFERRSRRVPADDIRDRLMFAATLRALSLAPDTTGTAEVAISLGTQIPLDSEAARCLPQLADSARFAARARELATSYGPRFEPPASLDTTPLQGKA